MKTIKQFLSELYRIWVTERPAQQAAALAYYSIFAFAPVIYVAYTIAGFFIRGLNISDLQFVQLEKILGAETMAFVYNAVAELDISTGSSSFLISLVGFLALLFAASGLFYQLQFALNRIWQVPPPKKGETQSMIRQRVFAFLIVIGLGLLLVLATLTSVVISFLRDLFLPEFNLPIPPAFIYILVVAGIFLLMYKILPQTKVGWRDVWLGALIAAALLTLGGYLVGLFLGSGRAGSALDAAGSFAVLLSAFYVFAQVFLFGAVFSRVYAKLHGTRKQVAAVQT